MAVRGLGLATLDVLRLLTFGRGGRIEGTRYIPSGEEPSLILPFSRDGLPSWPKPETAVLDRCFDLTVGEEKTFTRALRAGMELPAARCLTPLCDALTRPALRIMALCEAEHDEAGLRHWLSTEITEAGRAETRDGPTALRQGIAMAEGTMPPDAGYVIGQIWRKLQPLLREAFNLRQPEGAVAARLISFDDGLKRYSYGPPVLALRELHALIAAGLVSLRIADDPDIGLVPGGWRLVEDGTQLDAPVLIDAVLPGPKIEALSDPLFAGLRDAGFLVALEETGAARTDPSGQALDAEGAQVQGLSLLGRLATGSVIAADSLHDCLGERATRWAVRLLAEHSASG